MAQLKIILDFKLKKTTCCVSFKGLEHVCLKSCQYIESGIWIHFFLTSFSKKRENHWTRGGSYVYTLIY